MESKVQSTHARLAIPHQFQPRLSVWRAAVAVAAGVTQIFFGSLIAALWGVLIWIELGSGHGAIWKGAAALALATGMLISLGAMVLGVRALTLKISG